MLTIGNLKLALPLIVSPMAGITDLPFRRLNHRYGCELAFTEMINVRSLGYKSKKTFAMLQTSPDDAPLGVQLVGCEEKYITRGMDILKKFKYDCIDFNAACPQKKIVRRGEGAALLKDPKKLRTLLKLIVKHANVPVTVKIRSGWDNADTVRDIALYAQDAGINALFIHGRTKEQGYSGRVDYAAIQAVKRAVNIPVIANGDIFSAALAKKMLEETGVDAVAMARGILGNPWLIKEISEYVLHNRIVPRPDSDTITSTMREHLSLIMECYDERIGIVLFRKFFAWYTKGFHGVRPLRLKSCYAKTMADMQNLIDEFSAISQENLIAHAP